MKTITATLKSTSPYSQGKHYVPEKRQGENARDCEARTWRGRMHVNEDGNVFIPPMAFKNCLSEAAKFLSIQIPGKGKATFTKHFEAGVLVMDPLVLPIKADDVQGAWRFVPSDGKRGGGSRVDKCFPEIAAWSGDVVFHVLDETLLTLIDTPEDSPLPKKVTAFEWHLRQAGNFIGIGVFRPRNNGFYGRFTVECLKGL